MTDLPRHIKLLAKLSDPVGLVDIGAVGDLPAHWFPLTPHLAVYGFEPDKEACSLLNEQTERFAKARFFPYVIGGAQEKRNFHFARYGECSSLLLPNKEWLSRFSYGNCFDIIKTEETYTRTLHELDEINHEEIDAIKIDSQGMEIPILQGAGRVLKQAFLLEIETGMHENYRDETTFDQLAPFLRRQGFTCMQLNTQPAETRNNSAHQWKENKGQSMACESIWLRDLVNHTPDAFELSISKAYRCLSLCALFGFLDFGMELSIHFQKEDILDKEQFIELQQEDFWRILPEKSTPKFASAIAHLSHLLPTPLRRELACVLPEVIEQPNFLKRLFGFGRR